MSPLYLPYISPGQITNELFGSRPFAADARWSNPSLLLNLSIFALCKVRGRVRAR